VSPAQAAAAAAPTAPAHTHRAALGVLSAGHCSVDFCQGAVPAMLPFLVQQRHISYAAAAALVLAQTASSSVVQPIFGRLSDRWAMPWLMPAGVAVAAVGIGAASVAPTYALMWVMVAISGLGIAAYHPEGARYANRASGARRATGMSVFTVGGNLGFALGPLVCAGLLVTFGLAGGWALALPGLAMASVLVGFQPRLARVESQAVGRASGGRPPAAQPRDRWGPFARLTLALFARSVVFYGLNTFIPLFWVEVLGQPKAVGGSALTVMLVAGAAGTLLAGRIADRFSRRLVVACALAAALPLVPCLGLISSPVAATVLLVPMSVALFMPSTVMVVMGQEYLPNRIGTASGVTQGLAISVGGIAAPALGALADQVGLRPMFLLLTVMPLVAMCLVLTLPREAPSRA
jgi:FSR family fosmidomycin resistance protein-like MFS transporter